MYTYSFSDSFPETELKGTVFNILLPLSWSKDLPLEILQFATRWQAKTLWHLISFEKEVVFQVRRPFSEPEEDPFEVRLSHILQKISLKMSSASSLLH